MHRFFIVLFFVSLDPVDLNGDEYQNVQISSDRLSFSANHPNNNNSNSQAANHSRQTSTSEVFLLFINKSFPFQLRKIKLDLIRWRLPMMWVFSSILMAVDAIAMLSRSRKLVSKCPASIPWPRTMTVEQIRSHLVDVNRRSITILFEHLFSWPTKSWKPNNSRISQ